jgi:splicing factor 3A subunit 1
MEVDMDMEDEGAAARQLPQQQQEGQQPEEEEEEEEEGPIKVVKDYVRPAARPGARGGVYDPSKYAVSPITGELVPIEQMAEHMRVSLIDPRWV